MKEKGESGLIIFGGIWGTPSVSEQPEILVERWRVIEVLEGPCAGERHIVGYNCDDYEGRVSTAIVRYDPEARQCVTKSGRVYALAGRPGYDRDGDYVWKAWCRANGVTAQVDVSAMYAEMASRDAGR